MTRFYTRVWYLTISLVGAAAPLVCTHSSEAASRAFDCVAGGQGTVNGAELLSKVQKRYEGVSSLRARFEQDSYFAATDSFIPSKGEVLFGKPGKMRWHYDPPEEQVFVLNDGNFWAYQAEQHQVTVDQVDKVLISKLPVTWLMGVGNLSKDFSLASACRGPEGVVLNLTPKVKTSRSSQDPNGLQKFALLVDESTNLPKGAQVFHVGGNVDALVLANLAVNPTTNPIGAKDFEASFPKGADIIDNRAARAANRTK